MERAFRQWCKQQLPISTTIGERIYPMQAPQAAPLPRMVYQEISSVPLLSQDKFSGSQTSRLQITVHAADYGTAKQLSRTLAGLSPTFRGMFVGDPAKIRGAIPQGVQDLPSETPAGADKPISSVSQDWLVHWKE